MMGMDVRRQRWVNYVFLLCVWAGIYLPHLGTPELKEKEGRRVVPAITMIETGNWLVPSVGGEDYYKKPPMMNWLVAGSLIATGHKSTAVVRLPSVVFILAFVTFLVWMPGRWLDGYARLTAAIVFLTNISLVDKGRLAEIEAVYISLTGLAVVSWLNGWAGRASRWSLWLLPSFFVGIGLLVKGPVILWSYYATVATVLVCEGRGREFLTKEHVAGVMLAGTMFFAWMIPARLEGTASGMGNEWVYELVVNALPFKVDWTEWFLNIWRAFRNFLPWLIFVPLLWQPWAVARIEPDRQSLFKACRRALVVAFVPTVLILGNRPRYALPTFPLASVLVGWVLSRYAADLPGRAVWRGALLVAFPLVCLCALGGLILVRQDLGPFIAFAVAIGTCTAIFHTRHRLYEARPLVAVTAVLVVVAMIQYTVFAAPIAAARGRMRPAGHAVNAAVPPGEKVYFLKPGFSSFLFYIDRPLVYVDQGEPLPADARFVVTQRRYLRRLNRRLAEDGRSSRLLYHLDERIKGSYRLLEVVSPEPQLGDVRRWVNASCPNADDGLVVGRYNGDPPCRANTLGG
jgi:4-amino-4-deoxy-L-arabinose transferase-like glycosyltransferase